jgi:hypothetical protein
VLPRAPLKDTFVLALQRAEAEANERLDEILSAGDKPLIVKVDLSLRNRELTSEADVEAFVKEVRERLLEQYEAQSDEEGWQMTRPRTSRPHVRTIEILVYVVQELEICKGAGDARMVQTTRTTGP